MDGSEDDFIYMEDVENESSDSDTDEEEDEDLVGDLCEDLSEINIAPL